MLENQNNMCDLTHDLQTPRLSQTHTFSDPTLPWSMTDFMDGHSAMTGGASWLSYFEHALCYDLI